MKLEEYGGVDRWFHAKAQSLTDAKAQLILTQRRNDATVRTLTLRRRVAA